MSSYGKNNYSSSWKKDSPSTIPTYSRSNKTDVDKIPKITTSKYGQYNSSTYQPNSNSSIGNYTSRIKSTLDKHPPVSYKNLSRNPTTSRSRDASPIDRLLSEKTSNTSSSSSSTHNPNRLYPRSYSKERTLSPTSTNSSVSNLPKYTGRSSVSSERSCYGGRTSSESIPRYTGRSSTSSLKDESNVPKYINSRFLPKNSVEKSYTAYTRPSLSRTNETSRKNKEMLTILHAQQEHERLSRPSSRCSLNNDETSKSSSTSSSKYENINRTKEEVVLSTPSEMETINVITRSTSPSMTTQPTTFLRSRRITVAKTVEKTITRPKVRNTLMIDKEIQSDRLDDSTKSSRFVGASRISATPWSSFLDMKFSSPNSNNNNEGNISRTSSSKSISSNKSDKSSKKVSNKTNKGQKQLLPPQIPKSTSISTPNKDFRKSVLNMNKNKNISRKSNSGSSESDVADPDATDVSENLNTCCKSYEKSSNNSNKKSADDIGSDISISSSEDDNKTKKKSLRSGGSSRTSISADELSVDKSTKQSKSSEQEAKSFLMRALAPVTNLFKNNNNKQPSTSPDKVNWILNSSDSPTSTSEQNISEPRQAKLILHRVESIVEKPQIIKTVDSGELPWWLQKNPEVPEGVKTYPNEETEVVNNTKVKIKHIESGEAPWWLDNQAEVPEGIETYPNWVGDDGKTQDGRIIYKQRPKNESDESSWWNTSSSENTQSKKLELHKLRHIDSGERSWWNQSNENINEDSFYQSEAPLGDRASPEGLEMPKDEENVRPLSPYDNVQSVRRKRPDSLNFYISKHKNIDDVLGGGSIWSPLMERIFAYNELEGYTHVDPNEVIIHEGTPQNKISSQTKLDDATLQLYKDGDYGSYLDLEASISEQQEEFEGFQTNKKNSIVLRTQLSVRVHTIIEKLLTSEGRELRRALFSLKQIFQEDKDLVHEFVQNDGLSCLIKVGSEADQNYQNYILRALGQVMLYVDGMNGVMEHNQTIQWLYSLISSKFRLVVKTALKLLLVFVEYTESNCVLLIKAIHSVDYPQGVSPYSNVMRLLKDFDAADTELLIYAMTLINKILSGVPDQDTYYDQVDILEEQGIEAVIQRYMSKQGTDLDLLQQFQIYEAVLQFEDGEDMNNPIRHLDESMKNTLRNRKSLNESSDRRKSRRHSTGNTPYVVSARNQFQKNLEDFEESSSSQNSGISNSQLNGSYKDSNKAIEAGVTPALKRRRERAERQRSFMKEQQETEAILKAAVVQGQKEQENGGYTNGIQQRIANGNMTNRIDLTSIMNNVNTSLNISNSEENNNENERNLLIQLKRENTVKDLTQKLSNQNILHSPPDDNKINRIGDMSGLISKAKEGLAKSKSRTELKSPTGENTQKTEQKKSENELRWEELVSNLNRSLNLCDMDFTDLGSDDETDILAPAAVANGVPPPPPPLLQAPPPPPIGAKAAPPMPPMFGQNSALRMNRNETKIPVKKNKKTVKLFWKEVRDDPISMSKLKSGSIWDELSPVNVDTQKLEHLFESRAKDLITKKQQEMNKNKEVIVLDPKRSNAINIGMTKLPPPRSIKTAILKMDATVMNREGIEKLLTMLPTEEERTKIQEAQAANPDLPLGSAEQFLLTLASISELPARLKLWAFKLDFENSEKEIAEPLMDLKQGVEVLKINKTFRGILSTLLSIGNFLNGNEVKGFQIEYLAKVPEVKDTVHKHSLLHHLCHIVMEKFPEATDLYSEIGAITRASKIDFDELSLNIQRLESDCKSSWDHLKLIAKHDGSTMMKVKMSDFLTDCAERIIILEIIHRRIMNRFHKFLLFLGIPLHQIGDAKPNEFCRVVSEFALEYRTTRERVIQQLEKKANHRERNKTRGKMITDMGKFKSKEDRADAELRQLLGSDMSDVESLQGTLPWRRTRKEGQRSSFFANNGNLTDGDDEILESLVKTATKGVNSRTAPRERKRTRHADRKSLRRTLKNGLSEEEKKHLSAYIKGY